MNTGEFLRKIHFVLYIASFLMLSASVCAFILGDIYGGVINIVYAMVAVTAAFVFRKDEKLKEIVNGQEKIIELQGKMINEQKELTEKLNNKIRLLEYEKL